MCVCAVGETVENELLELDAVVGGGSGCVPCVCVCMCVLCGKQSKMNCSSLTPLLVEGVDVCPDLFLGNMATYTHTYIHQ